MPERKESDLLHADAAPCFVASGVDRSWHNLGLEDNRNRTDTAHRTGECGLPSLTPVCLPGSSSVRRVP
ncbi:hypothetical protein RHECIAT_CH0002811 [Rhizobium etli CIAT 652]|uniref:Uncharacterized protein n=1 Tax=Rhizobium etli (strain CIAT 652) TaxID=491916 RepID=B3PSR4_RHIE6|nr:hypothetical protein RHECIAT_CH0002811 [Rhizobium etli CIAT 652]